MTAWYTLVQSVFSFLLILVILMKLHYFELKSDIFLLFLKMPIYIITTLLAKLYAAI